MLGNLSVHEWRELRKILNKGFNTRQFKAMVPLVQQKIDKLIDKLNENQSQEIDFYKFYQRLTLDIIGRTAFGVDTDVQYNKNDRFLLAVKQEFAKSANNYLVKLLLCFPEFSYIIQGFRKSIEYVKEKIGFTSTSLLWTDCETTLSMRKSFQTSGDEVKDLLQIMIDMKLSDERIIAQTVLFNEAAFETMSSSLAFITHFLLNNNDLTQELAAEVDEYVVDNTLDERIVDKLPLMDSVINETLRLYPPQTTFISRFDYFI
jgi:PHYB activation tagged suppressor 1